MYNMYMYVRARIRVRTVAERGNSEWRVIICDVVATALRRRSDIAATSLRQRCDVAATNARRISEIAETSPRRRCDVVAACTALLLLLLSSHANKGTNKEEKKMVK